MLPNNVLIIGGPHTGKIQICQFITKDLKVETLNENSHSGILYKHDFSTQYYKIKLNLLVEEFPETRDRIETQTEDERYESLVAWFNEFKGEEFKELREALDGFIFTINIDQDSIEYLEKCCEIIHKIRNQLNEDVGQWDGLLIVAGVVESSHNQNLEKAEQIEDLLITYGFEFVDLSKRGYNEYKEKLGEDRLLEIFESHEWSNIDLNKDNGYEQNKYNKLDEMTKGLLDVEEEENEEEEEEMSNVIEESKSKDKIMDLDQLFARLLTAKENVSMLKDNEREDYVNKVIKDVINYI